jgi:hypothetical protein
MFVYQQIVWRLPPDSSLPLQQFSVGVVSEPIYRIRGICYLRMGLHNADMCFYLIVRKAEPFRGILCALRWCRFMIWVRV